MITLAITLWRQVMVGGIASTPPAEGPGGVGSPIGLLLALTKAS